MLVTLSFDVKLNIECQLPMKKLPDKFDFAKNIVKPSKFEHVHRPIDACEFFINIITINKIGQCFHFLPKFHMTSVRSLRWWCSESSL